MKATKAQSIETYYVYSLMSGTKQYLRDAAGEYITVTCSASKKEFEVIKQIGIADFERHSDTIKFQTEKVFNNG